MFFSAAVFTWTSTGTIYLRETGSVPQRLRLVRSANESVASLPERSRKADESAPFRYNAAMHCRPAGSAATAVLASLAAACSSPPPPAPPTPQRTTCADVLSVALPPGFTCSPRPSPAFISAFVEGPRVRLLLIAAPHLAPGDSSTDRPLRRGERVRPLSFNGLAANAIVTEGGLWESQMVVWVPDIGNGGDKLAALARWQSEPDEAIAADIIASTRVMRSPNAPPADAPAPAAGPAVAATPASPGPTSPAPGADPAGWLRHFAAFTVSFAAPGDLTVATHDPTEGANVSLDGKTFEVHVYLSADGVRSVAAQGQDTVASEAIVVDGPQGQLHRWHRGPGGGRPGRPFELELQARLAPDVHLSAFASCQTLAACGTAETILRSIRVVQKP
jgi:hypothetical protein